MYNSKDNSPQLEINNTIESLNDFLGGVRTIVRRLNNSQYHELELTTEKWSIKLAKNLLLTEDDYSANNILEPAEEINGAENEAKQQNISEILQETSKVIPIKSQMVGLFRSSSAHNGASKICQGDNVNEGQVIAGIEAVNIMHKVATPNNGRILEILVEDGDPVEYGQFLFLLATDKDVIDVQ